MTFLAFWAGWMIAAPLASDFPKDLLDFAKSQGCEAETDRGVVDFKPAPGDEAVAFFCKMTKPREDWNWRDRALVVKYKKVSVSSKGCPAICPSQGAGRIAIDRHNHTPDGFRDPFTHRTVKLKLLQGDVLYQHKEKGGAYEEYYCNAGKWLIRTFD